MLRTLTALSAFFLTATVVLNLFPRPETIVTVPTSQFRLSRETELSIISMLPTADTPAESARCLGLLHACQSWLALKDGVSNDIVITSPGKFVLDFSKVHWLMTSSSGDGKTTLVNHTGLVLPKAGHRISDRIWSVMQESCRYGFSDLR